MTNREILEKAIQKAINGGWQPYYTDIINDSQKIEVLDWLIEVDDLEKHNIKYKDYFEFIFNHDFAKSLWGDAVNPDYVLAGKNDFDYANFGENWQYHLQMMAISGDPIKYLGENI